MAFLLTDDVEKAIRLKDRSNAEKALLAISHAEDRYDSMEIMEQDNGCIIKCGDEYLLDFMQVSNPSDFI